MGRKLVKALGSQPYALPAFLQDFEPISDYTVGYTNVPKNVHEDMYDQTEFAIECNENITDFELHDYIVQTEGKIASDLYKGMQTYQQMEEQDDELISFIEEIHFLHTRCMDHPAMRQF